jgi:Arc/MetJ-type ribon-helix-helix transcriptional regulator
MAENITQTNISRPAPYLEAAGQTIMDLTTKLTGQPVDTSKFAPQIAGQNALTQQAQQQAATQGGLGTLTFDPTTGAVTGAGAGTGIAGYQPFLDQAAAYSGPQAYQQFMSPYQQDVIDTTLSQYDIQAQKGMQPLAANQVNAGAFGQGRGQVQQAEYQSQSDMNRALLQAQLQQQGYGQAQSAAAQAQQQQAGLASLQPSLAQSGIQQLGAAGTSNLAYQQAIQDAQSQAAQTAAYEPYNRLQFLSATTGGLLSGQPQAYMSQASTNQPTASPLSSALSGAATIYGLGSLYNR